MRAISTTLLLWVQDWFGRMLMPPLQAASCLHEERAAGGSNAIVSTHPKVRNQGNDGPLFCCSRCALLRIGNHSKRFADQLSQYANGLLFVGFDLARSRVSLG
jgi:hypothetical protein